jgi:hypothetical protein
MVTSKVTSFLFVNPIYSIVNGILLHTMTMLGLLWRLCVIKEEAVEARGLKSNMAHAWKSRRKKSRSSTTAPRTATIACALGSVLPAITTGPLLVNL